MRIKLYGIVLAGCLLAGCASHLGNFTGASTASYEPKNIDEQHLVTKGANGDSSCYIIILFPTCANPRVDEAMANALISGKGDYMQNAQIHHTWWYIPYIFGKFTISVTGDVYKTRL